MESNKGTSSNELVVVLINEMIRKVDYNQVPSVESDRIAFLHCMVAHALECAMSSISNYKNKNYLAALIMARTGLEQAIFAQYLALDPNGLKSARHKAQNSYLDRLKKWEAHHHVTSEHKAGISFLDEPAHKHRALTITDVINAFKEREELHNIYSYLSTFSHISSTILGIYTCDSKGSENTTELLFDSQIQDAERSQNAAALASSLAIGALSFSASYLFSATELEVNVHSLGFQTLLHRRPV